LIFSAKKRKISKKINLNAIYQSRNRQNFKGLSIYECPPLDLQHSRFGERKNTKYFPAGSGQKYLNQIKIPGLRAVMTEILIKV
jgi:hypothetical protein